MTKAWASAKIANCLTPISLAGVNKIQTRDYKTSGRFPVIDQGQENIAGWTDEVSAVIKAPLPLIVFGDHTRAFKYMDTPFARGADGTQLLRPNNGIDPLFFFYACRAIDLTARGYNRHFSVLKEKEIAYPIDGVEQKAIATVLRYAEDALMQQSYLLKSLKELKTATMLQLFTCGLRGKTQQETELGFIPLHWEVDHLGTHHSVVSGGTPSRGNPVFWTGGTIPWAKTTEVNYCVIGQTGEHITAEGLASSAAKLLPSGTILLAMYGQGVTRGRVAILGIEAACNQACAAITPKDDTVAPKFLYHFLAWRYEAIRELAHGGQQQNLNLDIVRDLNIAYPADPIEQLEIVEILDALDQKILLHKEKKSVLDELFRSLLNKLMTGELSVNDLDLSALSNDKMQPQAEPEMQS